MILVFAFSLSLTISSQGFLDAQWLGVMLGVEVGGAVGGAEGLESSRADAEMT